VKKNILNSEQGFTLVELMVVVAIIGILSAIAVPNFKKYQAKAKQSEAKIQLAALYNSEVGSSADWDTYATCLRIMGYEQSPKGYYAIGFGAGFDISAINPAYTTAGCTTGTTISAAPAASDIAYLPITQLAAVVANKATALAHIIGTSTTQNAFVAGAAGSISSAVTRDVWTINNAKALTNTTPGY
jgi:type IV pilus assembly protein PilA